VGSDKIKKVVPALPAASILLVRDARGGLEVLMIERAKTMRFAPGALVFPGGKVDREDSQRWRWHRYLNHNRNIPSDSSLRIAAVRELYEETNILLGETSFQDVIRTKLCFEKLLARGLVKLKIDDMVPFAHWITPETMPRRFDTYFFLAADEGHIEKHDGNEAVAAKWYKPREILADWENDKVPLMFPTRLNLMKLARSSTVASALQAARQTPVVRILPQLEIKDRGVNLTIQKAAGYDVTRASAKELKVEAPKS